MAKSKTDLIAASPSREAYGADEDQGEVFTSDDPWQLFEQWLALANIKEANDANAMALATIDGDGMPDVRMVLLKEIDEGGFTFFTNSESAKGVALAVNPKAAACFHWKSIRRQVRFRGRVERVAGADADAYFATRARAAQIGAWASAQSQPLDQPATLTEAIAQIEQRFADRPVPRPPHWEGYRLCPAEIEFWVNRPYRLHERMRFTKPDTQSLAQPVWCISWLYP